MKPPRTTVEQWQILQAIVDAGGFARGAASVHRSQSAASYAVARLQEQLDVPLLRQQGRRSVLTEAGKTLLREARPVIDALLRLEARADSLKGTWEPEVHLAVDSMLPSSVLRASLARFADDYPDTRLQLREEVLSGTDELLRNGQADLAVSVRIPSGFLGDWLTDVEFVAVAHPEHPLHQLGREATPQDLTAALQLVVRDSGTLQPRDEGWLEARQRWTVSSVETAAEVIGAGLGFAWLPSHTIAELLARGELKPLPLVAGQRRQVSLYLIVADHERAGPATRALAKILQHCARQAPVVRATGDEAPTDRE